MVVSDPKALSFFPHMRSAALSMALAAICSARSRSLWKLLEMFRMSSRLTAESGCQRGGSPWLEETAAYCS